jgi:CcmD family protein
MNDVMTAICRRAAVVVLALVCLGTPAVQSSVFAQQPAQQDEFRPLDQLPPAEQIPAASLLIAAYAIVLVVLFLYLVSVARRLSVVQREVERLEADVKRAGRT